MTTVALWHITVLGWVALGYVLGRLRLRDRLKAWVWDQMTFRTPHAAPWPRQAAVAAGGARWARTYLPLTESDSAA